MTQPLLQAADLRGAARLTTDAVAGLAMSQQGLRLQGIYQWLVGNGAAAEQLWERSIREAQRLGAIYALRATYLERGRRLQRQSDLEAASTIAEELRVDVASLPDQQ